MAICLATKDLLRAVSGTRTRDPQLGKLMLYQLSYYRITFISGAKIEFYCEIAKRNHIKYLFFDQKAEFFFAFVSGLFPRFYSSDSPLSSL